MEGQFVLFGLHLYIRNCPLYGGVRNWECPLRKVTTKLCLLSLLRAVVAILDSFHFKVTEEHQDSDPPAEQQEEGENDEDEKMEDESTASSLPQRIHSTILNTILPGLESCLTKEVLLTTLDLI